VLLTRRALGFGCAALWACDGRAFSGVGDVLAIAADDGHVYWTAGLDNAAILRAPHRGDEIAVLHDGMTWPRDVALARDSAFVATALGVVRAPLLGVGGAVWAADVEVHRVVADELGVAWIARERHALVHVGGRRFEVEERWPRALAMDLSHVYLVAARGLLRVARSNGETTLLASEPRLSEVALSKDAVWVIAADGVARIAKRGGALELRHRAPRAAALCVVADTPYWSQGDALMRDGAPLARGVPQALGVGGGYLYWAEDGDLRRATL
jgi:hypothetical protein